MINKNTLTMLKSLIQLDYGFTNGHGVMFFQCNEDDTVAVQCDLDAVTDNNTIMFLSLEELTPEELLEQYHIVHLEDLIKITPELIWEEYHHGKGFLSCLAGEEAPQSQMEFRIKDEKTMVRDLNNDVDLLLNEMIDSGARAEAYVRSAWALAKDTIID